MRGMLHGQSLMDIAADLGITNKSVSTYRRRVLEKLGVGNNADLVALATRFGLI